MIEDELKKQWQKEQEHAFKGWNFLILRVGGKMKICLGIIPESLRNILKPQTTYLIWEPEGESFYCH